MSAASGNGNEASGAPSVLAVTGGIGGAKLALGLYRTLAPGALALAVNTGDDFEHLGLTVCPDLDTTLYTLAGCSNAETGWGRAGETWQCLAALRELGGPDWFALGDRDLATHLLRSDALRRGQPLAAVTAGLAARLGVQARLLPASDDPVRTLVATGEGELAFQDYFVRRRCEPAVQGLRYAGAGAAGLQGELADLLRPGRLEAIVICPSNPYLSIDPMLAIPGFAGALRASGAPVVAVSPIVSGRAIKGPTAKIMSELGVAAGAASVARHYASLIDGFILDSADAHLATAMPMPVTTTQTIMTTLADREQLARQALAFARSLRRR